MAAAQKGPQTRARIRARESRLRAIRRPIKDTGNSYYTVYNLAKHKKYIVWWNGPMGMWECTCPTNSRDNICKHVARVKDCEEQRIRSEALTNG